MIDVERFSRALWAPLGASQTCPAGQSARSARLGRGTRALAALLATSLLAFFLPGAASASRPHEFAGTIGVPCTVEPCTGNQLKKPAGLAVEEASGDVYVADEAARRIVRLGSSGGYVGEITGPSAAGSGSLSAGSKTVESVLTTSGAFTPGETISSEGGGVPAGTTITAVKPGGILELSQGATSSELASLKAEQRFTRPEEIAVDNSCTDQHLSGPECAERDPSAGDLYVLDAGVLNSGANTHQLDKFSLAGEYLGQITEGGGAALAERGIDGVAVDATGEVWVYPERAEVLGYSDANPNVFVRQISSVHPEDGPGVGYASPGFGVAAGPLFLGRMRRKTTGSDAVAWNGEGELLAEELGGPEATGVTAAPAPLSEEFVDTGTSVTVFDSQLHARETLGEEAGSKHLLAGTALGVNGGGAGGPTGGYLYVSDQGAGDIVVFGYAQPSVPVVEGESFSKVTSTEATLTGQVNPSSVTGEEATVYRFEYGACPVAGSCTGAPYLEVPGSAGDLSPSFDLDTVDAALGGLQPHTTYHFRIITSNQHGGGAPGPETLFTTQAAGGPAPLPDKRAWEMVSPPAKQGARIEPLVEAGIVKAAADGTALTYLANAPTEPTPDGFTNFMQILSRRTPAGWTTRDLGVPHKNSTGLAIGGGQEYKFFDSELSAAIVHPFGEFDPAVSEEASEDTPYVQDVAGACATRCYRPVLSGKPGYANVPEGIQFGEEQSCRPQSEGANATEECGATLQAATADLQHVVITAIKPLEPGAAGGALYEWTAGTLAPVSVLPGAQGQPVAAELGQTRPSSRGPTQGALSNDGQQVVWTAKNALFVRDMARRETVEIDQAGHPCNECVTGGGIFQFASADGDRVLFTDTNRLTQASGTAGGADLYECVIVTDPALSCELHDLTPVGPNHSANIEGNILGADTTGATVYFVAGGVLAGENAAGHAPIENEPNLYVHTPAGTSFIATLSRNDEHDWTTQPSAQPTEVSTDGRFLVFVSQQSLTGYDNRDVKTGQPDAEVYEYDDQTRDLVCGSCLPTGERPTGVRYTTLESGSGGMDGENWWFDGPAGLPVAAIVPGWTTDGARARPLYHPRYLDEDGRVFFDSVDALVPQDTNGVQDVYEYEPPGVGSCSEASDTFSVKDGGCVSLVSSGSSGGESGFLDASESGNDVFFLTSAQLSLADKDHAPDVYDAHVCSEASPCLAQGVSESSSCLTETACRPALTPQPSLYGAPPSATYSGPGNQPPAAPGAASKPKPTAAQVRAERLKRALRACRKNRSARKRRSCERTARRRYGPASHTGSHKATVHASRSAGHR